MSAEQPDNVDDTFARIVAGYDSRPERGDVAPWPAAEDVEEQTTSVDAPFEYRQADPFGFQPAAAPGWDEEDHFVPPAPPPLPRPEPLTLLAWAGVLGAPFAFVLAAVSGLVLPRMVTGALVVGFVGGIFWLIATTSRRPGEGYDPDDGAVV